MTAPTQRVRGVASFIQYDRLYAGRVVSRPTRGHPAKTSNITYRTKFLRITFSISLGGSAALVKTRNIFSIICWHRVNGLRNTWFTLFTKRNLLVLYKCSV